MRASWTRAFTIATAPLALASAVALPKVLVDVPLGPANGLGALPAGTDGAIIRVEERAPAAARPLTAPDRPTPSARSARTARAEARAVPARAAKAPSPPSRAQSAPATARPVRAAVPAPKTPIPKTPTRTTPTPRPAPAPAPTPAPAPAPAPAPEPAPEPEPAPAPEQAPAPRAVKLVIATPAARAEHAEPGKPGREKKRKQAKPDRGLHPAHAEALDTPEPVEAEEPAFPTPEPQAQGPEEQEPATLESFDDESFVNGKAKGHAKKK